MWQNIRQPATLLLNKCLVRTDVDDHSRKFYHPLYVLPLGLREGYGITTTIIIIVVVVVVAVVVATAAAAAADLVDKHTYN